MSLPDHVSGAVLKAAQTAPLVPIEQLAPGACLLLVIPHPDDETFGCGMALAAAVASGRRVVIVLLTDGEASHPSSTRYDCDALAALRRAELREALELLCPGEPIAVHRLGLPDGASTPADIQPETVDCVAGLASMNHASAIWTTWAGDPHCDHQTAATLSARVAQRLAIPHLAFAVWGRFGERTPPPGLARFHDSRFLARKGAAIRCYRSQTGDLIDDDPDGFVMPPAFLVHFASQPEIFIREQ